MFDDSSGGQEGDPDTLPERKEQDALDTEELGCGVCQYCW